jgi:hypothetical protein
MIMKRIAQSLLVVSLATTGVAALAATPSYPSSAQETTSLSSQFPNMRTYADSHRDDVASQPAMTYPSAAIEQMPLSSVFPNIQTHADLHRIDPVVVSSMPTFPSSANETTSLAELGLVPGVDSGGSIYAGVAEEPRN